jgi:hypothetical protein
MGIHLMDIQLIKMRYGDRCVNCSKRLKKGDVALTVSYWCCDTGCGQHEDYLCMSCLAKVMAENGMGYSQMA